MTASDPQTHDWHVDRRVPLALIWAIGAQTVAVIVAGSLAWAEIKTQSRDIARIEQQIERDVRRLDRQSDAQSQASNAQAVQLGRIEENLAATRNDIRRLLTAIEGGP